MGKQLRLSDEVHHTLSVIKFYTNIPMENFCNELVKEALISSILGKVLMNFLLDRKKVEFVLQKLKEA